VIICAWSAAGNNTKRKRRMGIPEYTAAMRSLFLATVLGLALLGCTRESGVGGRWQGANDPGSESPVTVAFYLRVVGDSLRGWGVARTDGRQFPITAHGTISRGSVNLILAPWRIGVIDIESAQLSGTLGAKGEIKATLRTDAGIGEGPVTPLTLTRPAP
jgi:hypothetical protein